MTIDNTHCTGTYIEHNMLILTLFLVVSQGIVEEGLVSFCSSKRNRVLGGVMLSRQDFCVPVGEQHAGNRQRRAFSKKTLLSLFPRSFKDSKFGSDSIY